MKYSIDFEKFSTYFGISDNYNRSASNYIENGSHEYSRLGINSLHAYAQIAGRLFNKLSYTASAGLRAMQSSTQSENKSAVRAKGYLGLTYNFSRPFSLRYNFIYDPSMPNTENQSDIVQSVSDIEVRTGNIDLRPYTILKNSLTAMLLYNNYGAALTMSHARTYSPIYEDYTLITDPSSLYYNRFLSQYANGRRNYSYNIEVELMYRNLFNHLNLWLNGGWCDYETRRDNWNDSYNFWYGGINASFYISNFTLSAQYTFAPFYGLSGNTFSRPERWNTITAQYKYRNFYFSVTAVNLFTKRGSLYHSWSYTPAHTIEDWVDIRDCANMVMIGITYRTDFGRSMKKASRTLRNGGVDSGINMDL